MSRTRPHYIPCPPPRSRRFVDRTGRDYGSWHVLGYFGRDPKTRGPIWSCRCTCGAVHLVRGENLARGSSLCCVACRPRTVPDRDASGRFLATDDPDPETIRARCALIKQEPRRKRPVRVPRVPRVHRVTVSAGEEDR